MVEFIIFILVSMPLGFVPWGLSGSPWGTFEFWNGLTRSQNMPCNNIIINTGYWPRKTQIAKSADISAFYIKK